MKLEDETKKDIEKGLELLKLCLELQSEKDGVERPKLYEINKIKELDGFSRDISKAALNMSLLYKLIPMMNELSELGRKLEKDGKITIEYGDSYFEGAFNYLLENK